MNDVTETHSAIEKGDASAPEQLLLTVFSELRKMAAAKLAQEKPGQTLQPTALVHEAYLRLVDSDRVERWDSRRHFFAAAAEAMRRILVDNARRKARPKHGGDRVQISLELVEAASGDSAHEVPEIDEVLDRLVEKDETAGEVAKLCYFSGLTVELGKLAE